MGTFVIRIDFDISLIMKIYQITQTQNFYFLYPTPVNKQNKFLIKAPSLRYAEFLKLCLENGQILSPFDVNHPFQKVGLHTDGQTIIYEVLKEKLTLDWPIDVT
jgi:hypothetical protein